MKNNSYRHWISGVSKKGFTLIELLVVIAVIGILASVVLASLNSARQKGRVANIKANLKNAVTQSSLYYSNNGTYSGLCSDSTMQSFITALGGTGSAACYVASALSSTEFGLAAIYNGEYFVASPDGVLQIDTTNTGGTANWASALTACSSTGKRLMSVSSFKAIYDIAGSLPQTFSSNVYYSTTENPVNSAQVYRISLGDGAVYAGDKTSSLYVRCGM